MTAPLPDEMVVIEIPEPGGPEALKPGRRPLPTPGAEEVLVKVAASGVNRPDVMQRKGMYPPPPGAPDTPGLEIAGEVMATGEGVSSPAIGARVCALVAGGGYAEYCVAPAALCLPWTNVFDRGRLKSGERFLVHGGSSGIGTTAIQLAKAFGATVYATAGTAEKCEACERLGAEAAINYRQEDFVERIGALTEGKGVDLILDMIAGDYLPRNLKCLAVEGRLVQIALQNLLPVMLKRLTITGSTLRPRSVAQKAEIAAALKAKVWPLIAQGKVKPVIHATFPLKEAAKAHALMESSKHIGKILLTN